MKGNAEPPPSEHCSQCSQHPRQLYSGLCTRKNIPPISLWVAEACLRVCRGDRTLLPPRRQPAAGLATFPRRSKLWVVTSQTSTRKGLLKRAWGAHVTFRGRGWERRPEAAPALVPRSLMLMAALCDT